MGGRYLIDSELSCFETVAETGAAAATMSIDKCAHCFE